MARESPLFWPFSASCSMILMLWSPSSRVITITPTTTRFAQPIRSALKCAEQNPESIIVVGADAEYPEVDYGWIEPGLVVSESVVAPLARVNRFWEKPPLHEARTLLSRDCLWNTFVTVGRAATFFEMLCSQVPEAVLAISRAVAENTLDVAYPLLDTLDFSRDVLTNLPHKLLVLRDRTSGWADLGSPARVLETLESKRHSTGMGQ